MYSAGTKLEINSDFAGIGEVIGIYPRGQSNYSEDHVQILINGYRMVVPASIIGTMFKVLDPNAQINEEVVIVEPEKPVIAEVKTIKKLTKKQGYQYA